LLPAGTTVAGWVYLPLRDRAFARRTKTLKYRPDFPDRFGCIEDARGHWQHFFQWRNTAHRHSGIALMTPQTVCTTGTPMC